MQSKFESFTSEYLQGFVYATIRVVGNTAKKIQRQDFPPSTELNKIIFKTFSDYDYAQKMELCTHILIGNMIEKENSLKVIQIRMIPGTKISLPKKNKSFRFQSLDFKIDFIKCPYANARNSIHLFLRDFSEQKTPVCGYKIENLEFREMSEEDIQEYANIQKAKKKNENLESETRVIGLHSVSIQNIQSRNQENETFNEEAAVELFEIMEEEILELQRKNEKVERKIKDFEILEVNLLKENLDLKKEISILSQKEKTIGENDIFKETDAFELIESLTRNFEKEIEESKRKNKKLELELKELKEANNNLEITGKKMERENIVLKEKNDGISKQLSEMAKTLQKWILEQEKERTELKNCKCQNFRNFRKEFEN